MERRPVGETPLISIIIPVYNIEAYLEKCLDSVMAQTYENLEVIVVDDASTDASGRICDLYARRDQRFLVVHFTKNHGVSHARNTGLDRARGSFIAFVDSDDFVERNMIETLYANLIKNRADVSIGGVKREGFIRYKYVNPYQNALSGVSSARQAMEFMIRVQFCVSVWGKLFTREILGDTRFAEKIHCGEDLLFLYKIFQKDGRVSYTSAPLYHYVFRADSIMQGDLIERKYTESVTCEYIYRDLPPACADLRLELKKKIININTRLAVKVMESETLTKGQKYRRLRLFQRNLRRYMDQKALIRFEHKKIAAEALLLYAGTKAFFTVTFLYKKLKGLFQRCARREV
ncbi:MAG: glycosyltransferase family 2 protein [Lachnospiraceae bacterium]|nr:glycosyltransferase family 2 protein [Lachnospiraceae bacterium]